MATSRRVVGAGGYAAPRTGNTRCGDDVFAAEHGHSDDTRAGDPPPGYGKVRLMISVMNEFGHYGGNAGPWWLVFPLLWFLLWIAVIVTAIVLWRRRNHPTRAAQSVLAEEFARGNITEEEYQQRLATLQRQGRA